MTAPSGRELAAVIPSASSGQALSEAKDLPAALFAYLAPKSPIVDLGENPIQQLPVAMLTF
jgi:hypothetical protein